MKYFVLEYTGQIFNKGFNLGDEIQTVAVSRLLPRVDGYVSREALDTAVERGIIPLNGFFLNSDHWPPAPGLTPVFFSFHIAPGAEKIICSPQGISYLKKHEPIGCRDTGTLDILSRHGIEAYYSKCLTLTLEKRNGPVADGKIYLVDVNKSCRPIIPRLLRKEAIRINQAKIRIPSVPSQIKLELAKHLFETYKRTARLIITSKMHCALPCIAMGIPVVFLYPRSDRDDYRVKIVDDLIGINYVSSSWLDRKPFNYLRSRQINWNPEPIDIEKEKQEIRTRFLDALHLAEERHKIKYPERTRRR
jgi:Polysaccharide pyruvyl transferase